MLIVGEACIEAAKQLTELPADIPWNEIKGMRNILVHEYWQIDETIIFKSPVMKRGRSPTVSIA